MKLLAAINVVMNLLGALVAAKPDESEDYARVNELLRQLKTLGEEALGRLLQRMNYIREILTRSTLPTPEAMRGFLDQVVQIIDCDARPFIPDCWKVRKHQKGGKLEWNPEKIQLYLSDVQRDSHYIKGNELCRKLKGKKVLNACVLDWLLAHPEFIPEQWKGKYIFFWGTEYRLSVGSFGIRCLFFKKNVGWCWSYYYLADDWGPNDPATVLADAA